MITAHIKLTQQLPGSFATSVPSKNSIYTRNIAFFFQIRELVAAVPSSLMIQYRPGANLHIAHASFVC